MDELQNKGQVTIHIDGKYGGEPLTPENYDITLMQTVLEHAIALLDLDKRKERPITTYHIESGSVSNVFTTSKQKAVEFASVLASAKQNIINGDIDRSSLRLLEMMEFEPKFDMAYLERKIEASTPVWSGIDADEFLHEIREGSYVGQ